ncbi:MAG: SprB repeat-containing protein [Lewinellaceae bacterium]|nr:SprB repeat-containing protein [Lewinellaceae bacterium]
MKAGEYSLTVIDATGQSQTASVAVAEPLPIEPTANVVAPASTGNADGQASASATGGTPPYSYAWDNGETGATASKLAPGTPDITDGAGCTANTSVEITENIRIQCGRFRRKPGSRNQVEITENILPAGGKPAPNGGNLMRRRAVPLMRKPPECGRNAAGLGQWRNRRYG